jgi:nucleoporin NUP82
MVPSAYIHALEYFVRAKEESAGNSQAYSESDTSSSHNGPSLSTLYAYQLKYVVSLSKQLPETPSTLFPAPSRSVPITAPSIVKSRPVRQGPFLFQPAPQELDQGPGGSATDMVYITVEGTSLLHPDEDGSEERLGLFAVAFSDGKIDICLDVEKVEATWETSQVSEHVSCLHSWSTNLYQFSSADTPADELPMVAVYETIDLGLVSMLSQLSSSEPASWLGKQQTTPTDHLELLQANHPVFVSDPIYRDTIYLYHAFGVHCLNMTRWLQPLARSLRNDVGLQVERLVNGSVGTEVTCLLDTFSQESKYVVWYCESGRPDC